MLENALAVIAIVAPVVAALLERVGSVRISERHHSHHDTYVVPASFTRALVLAMTFMSALGLLLGWLCFQGVLEACSVTVLGFFDAFVLTLFLLWRLLSRYRVSTFRDCMVVTPLVGPRTWVRYEDIERMEWSGLRMESGFRSLAVWTRGNRAVKLLGLVDLEQIIMSIDRFDLLPQAG